nr:MAG TPA: hypothetical protein [Caudoviricetes sp.]
MDEYTNESVDMFLEGLSDGDAEDTTPAEPEEQPATESAVEEQPQEPAPDAEDTTPAEEGSPETEEKPQTITIQYDGQTKELTLDEAVTLSQKGMNYDRMVQRYEDRLNNSRELQILDFFGRMYGKTRDEYVEYLWQQRESAVAQQEAAALRNQYPDAPASMIEQMSKERAKAKTAELERVAAEKKQQDDDEKLKPWYEFAQAYPEEAKDLSKLPSEVLEAAKNGEHPISAMRAYQLKQAEEELATLRQELEQAKKTETQNQKNRKSAIGSVGSTATAPPSDPFLAALLSDD